MVRRTKDQETGKGWINLNSIFREMWKPFDLTYVKKIKGGRVYVKITWNLRVSCFKSLKYHLAGELINGKEECKRKGESDKRNTSGNEGKYDRSVRKKKRIMLVGLVIRVVNKNFATRISISTTPQAICISFRTLYQFH